MPLSRFLVAVLGAYCLWVSNACAAPDVRVVGLFRDRAVLEIDGRQRILRVGETSPEGVRLLAADSVAAILEVDGREIRGTLDGRVSTRTKTPQTQDVQVWRDNQGMYATVGSINGLPVSFIVDTGATQVAMNAAEARRLGIDYRVVGTPAAITTASRTEHAWAVTLESVKVGEILLRNVPGIVLEGPQPEKVLLGMSYLGRLKISNDGQVMTLQKKY